ncbi:MAG TPA: maleylpyruvate isomerase family mycothiol-dependent enzyme [Pseudonocardiaceae bacterium]|jgi:uncharacterized protein (TIGR03083 family)|nr:maleylpyruvate isomerase family mycothiol-dependent enzyme [Pseudonocardiaceae bacterium]
MTANVDLSAEIAAERSALADVLAALPATAWDEPTLCAGWRVREVVAHVTMPFRYPMARFLAELARSGGRFDRMSDRCARRDSAVGSEVLLAAVRDNVRHPWQPPGGGLAGALTHDVIHGLDITVALGVGRSVPAERLHIVLAGLTEPKVIKHFGADLGGVELTATDLDWSFGTGTPVSGAAQDLALLLCGRKLPAGRLESASTRFS